MIRKRAYRSESGEATARVLTSRDLPSAVPLRAVIDPARSAPSNEAGICRNVCLYCDDRPSISWGFSSRISSRNQRRDEDSVSHSNWCVEKGIAQGTSGSEWANRTFSEDSGKVGLIEMMCALVAPVCVPGSDALASGSRIRRLSRDVARSH
jgi:hypothetical protein